jgi:hypothetical protein
MVTCWQVTYHPFRILLLSSTSIYSTVSNVQCVCVLYSIANALTYSSKARQAKRPMDHNLEDLSSLLSSVAGHRRKLSEENIPERDSRSVDSIYATRLLLKLEIVLRRMIELHHSLHSLNGSDTGITAPASTSTSISTGYPRKKARVAASS